LTREKAQEVMSDLVNRGELSKDEGAKFVKAMVDKAEEETAYLKKIIDERVSRTMSRFRPSYEEDIKRLENKLDKLSKQIEKLNKA
jgi:polyhydroxyalkanoate synthesis regulator phasin